MNRFVLAILLTSAALADCTGEHRVPVSIADRPLPETDAQRRQECTAIRAEILRERNRSLANANIANKTLIAPARQGGTPEDVDALEARASRIDCAAALSSRPRMMTELSLEACIARCQMLFADRTKQQCVVLCNE